jgi:hypothetical protein
MISRSGNIKKRGLGSTAPGKSMGVRHFLRKTR